MPGLDLSDGAGELVRLVRIHPPMTRAEVGAVTGWARATVNGRIDELLEHGLLTTAGPIEGARGRPATRFRLQAGRGTLLVADVGASAARVAVCDLDGHAIRTDRVPIDISAGPDAVLATVTGALDALRSDDDPPLWGLGISLPGPIEHASGRVVSPPIMTGWDGLVVPDLLEPRYGVPVLVENDADAMAWGEHVIRTPRVDDLLHLKVGTGVGAGLVVNGRIVRGANGAAGDLGHTRVAPVPGRAEAPLCRCGKLGCVEAYAGGWAIARDLAADGEQVDTLGDVLALIARGNPNAIRRVRDAGRILGAALAHAVSLLNPSDIVVGGQLAVAGEHLLSGIRERIAADSLPLATSELRIRIGEAPDTAGLIGLADALAGWVFSRERLADVLAR
ncbi:putative NBD/HSP70 family sugar kinase [Mumia flava]|uniref:Putative NBD/HSP70 family sugar kinase n=1 Tax=Mumia flava TaxID=1348852 RepID=A0A0B2B603_9ACTN|nr:ROK family protein [Mumia flava]PJJ53799.1 putative NBD/HSP70 family sugar kinase [Mumia flava]